MFFENFRNIFGWGALPPRPPNFWLGGQSPPRPPLNGRSSHLIEAAKRGRLDQMIFFSVPLTIRAPLTTPAPLTTRAPKKIRNFCDAIFFKKFVRLSPHQRSFLTKIRTVLQILQSCKSSSASPQHSSFPHAPMATL